MRPLYWWYDNIRLLFYFRSCWVSLVVVTIPPITRAWPHSRLDGPYRSNRLLFSPDCPALLNSIWQGIRLWPGLIWRGQYRKIGWFPQMLVWTLQLPCVTGEGVTAMVLLGNISNNMNSINVRICCASIVPILTFHTFRNFIIYNNFQSNTSIWSGIVVIIILVLQDWDESMTGLDRPLRLNPCSWWIYGQPIGQPWGN